MKKSSLKSGHSFMHIIDKQTTAWLKAGAWRSQGQLWATRQPIDNIQPNGWQISRLKSRHPSQSLTDESLVMIKLQWTMWGSTCMSGDCSYNCLMDYCSLTSPLTCTFHNCTKWGNWQRQRLARGKCGNLTMGQPVTLSSQQKINL